MSIRNPQTPEELARRREIWRTSKARARARAIAKMQSGVTCRVALGPHRLCLGRVLEEVDRLGRVRYTCTRCTRRRAGICQECPRRVYGTRGQALYCHDCKRRAVAAHNAKWVAHNRERKNASVRAYRRRKRAAVA